MSDKKGFFRNLIEKIEYYLPMTIGSFLMFIVIIYLFVLVGRTVWLNFQSNKSIEAEAQTVTGLQNEIVYLNNQINYFQTNSYKEKEARAKLGYKGVGEKAIALPVDKAEDKVEDRSLGQAEIRIPNYRLWWQYYFGK
jgi:cell division protein FtsB